MGREVEKRFGEYSLANSSPNPAHASCRVTEGPHNENILFLCFTSLLFSSSPLYFPSPLLFSLFPSPLQTPLMLAAVLQKVSIIKISPSFASLLSSSPLYFPSPLLSSYFPSPLLFSIFPPPLLAPLFSSPHKFISKPRSYSLLCCRRTTLREGARYGRQHCAPLFLSSLLLLLSSLLSSSHVLPSPLLSPSPLPLLSLFLTFRHELLSAKAQVDARDMDGNTVLHIITKKNTAAGLRIRTSSGMEREER